MESVVRVTKRINSQWCRQFAKRATLIIGIVLLSFLASSCRRLAKVSDTSIPRLLTPVVQADFQQLVAQLKPFTELQALRSSRVTLRFIEPLIEERWRDAEAI